MGEGDATGESDATDVRSLAVNLDDGVTAVESRREGRPAVLRATPPYHARMRARLHVRGPGDPPAIVVEPTDLLGDDAPAYPTPDETEARVRAAGEYTPEAHREAPVEAAFETSPPGGRPARGFSRIGGCVERRANTDSATVLNFFELPEAVVKGGQTHVGRV